MKKTRKNQEVQEQKEVIKEEVTAITEEKKERVLMTPKETASHSGIGLTRVYELIREPNFPKIKIGKKFYIITSKFEEWLVANIGEEFLQHKQG